MRHTEIESPHYSQIKIYSFDNKTNGVTFEVAKYEDGQISASSVYGLFIEYGFPNLAQAYIAAKKMSYWAN